MPSSSFRFLLLLSAAWLSAAHALALDKQGSAHGGSVSGAESGVALSGSALLGAALYNPTYAARPNNTGLALLRIASHFDLDLIGRHLSIPLDLNVFTDRQRVGAQKLIPSELDIITGLTSTWGLSEHLALEGGVRVERDSPIDRGTYAQAYGDARVRLLYLVTPSAPCVTSALHSGDLTGAFTLGWFVWNPTYAARPDNSGSALLRYGINGSMELADGWLNLGADFVAFTDRRTNALVPSELDASVMLGTHYSTFAFQLAFERDSPLDRRTVSQQLLMLSASTNFSIL